MIQTVQYSCINDKHQDLKFHTLNFHGSWENLKNCLKTLDVLIYACKNYDFDKHGNLFHMYTICKCNYYLCKTHFPIKSVKGKWPHPRIGTFFVLSSGFPSLYKGEMW